MPHILRAFHTKRAAVYQRFSARSVTVKRASLHHKSRHNAVDILALIIAAVGKLLEILHSDGLCLGKQLRFDCPEILDFDCGNKVARLHRHLVDISALNRVVRAAREKRSHGNRRA